LGEVAEFLLRSARSGRRTRDPASERLLSIIAAVKRATENAAARYGALPILFSGGVASNALLRREFQTGIFAEPRYSVDNALGAAILTYRAVKANEQ
jgi:N6-L-threonylcarbamoyladenine synthase